MSQKSLELCDVCGVGESIGVASTRVPYSCRYCLECAKRSAQPLFVFDYWYEYVGEVSEPCLETYINGEYISYSKWKELKDVQR